jgi:hypothetical protein
VRNPIALTIFEKLLADVGLFQAIAKSKLSTMSTFISKAILNHSLPVPAANDCCFYCRAQQFVTLITIGQRNISA